MKDADLESPPNPSPGSVAGPVDDAYQDTLAGQPDVGENRASSITVAYVRPALACLGALLLIVGQFCPMLTLPMGISVNFFDYSMKTAWLVSKAGSTVMDKAENPSYEPEVDLSRYGRVQSGGGDKPPKPSEKLEGVALAVGLVLTVISPFCPLLIIALAVCALVIGVRGIGRTRGRLRGQMLVGAGVLCLLALGDLFLGPTLVLWAIPEELSILALASSSFGFGWGVLLVGSIAVLVAGVIR